MPVTIDGTNGITQLPSSQGLINIVASRPESPKVQATEQLFGILLVMY